MRALNGILGARFGARLDFLPGWVAKWKPSLLLVRQLR
jgi:hypothetical protein